MARPSLASLRRHGWNAAQLPESVPADQQETTAYALLCTAHAAQTFEHLGFTNDPLQLARSAAALVVNHR